MNKSDLIVPVSRNAGCAKSCAEAVINEFLDQIIEAVSRGESVNLLGFGTFELKSRAERTARDLTTGEPIVIPARFLPVFKPGTRLLKAAGEFQKEETT